MNYPEDLKIGLALSGGGVRAAAFHLGMLWRLATDGLLERVTHISTVSGGSLVAGLVYTSADNHWPDSQHFLDYTLTYVRRALTTKRLQWHLMISGIIEVLTFQSPLFSRRAKALSRMMHRLWGIKGDVKRLPKAPLWIINATTYESGKNWRFTPYRMGDYLTGFTENPSIPLTDALAASAGFPALIGPLRLDCTKYEWIRYLDPKTEKVVRYPDDDESLDFKTKPVDKPAREVHLWDGGVYDNNGLEALYKICDDNYKHAVNFLVISEAGRKLGAAQYSCIFKRLRRILEISMDQVRSLRARSIGYSLEQNKGQGALFQIGNTAKYILNRTEQYTEHEIDKLIEGSLSQHQARCAASHPTDLKQISDLKFNLICQHGWEVADYTLIGYYKDWFQHRAYPGPIQ